MNWRGFEDSYTERESLKSSYALRKMRIVSLRGSYAQRKIDMWRLDGAPFAAEDASRALTLSVRAVY